MNSEKSQEDRYQKWFSALVPIQGDSPYFEGEILRAASRISYRYHNDGDGCYQSSSNNFLRKHAVTMAQKEPSFTEKAVEFREICDSLYFWCRDSDLGQGGSIDPKEETMHRLVELALDYVELREGRHEFNFDSCLNPEYEEEGYDWNVPEYVEGENPNYDPDDENCYEEEYCEIENPDWESLSRYQLDNPMLDYPEVPEMKKAEISSTPSPSM